VDRDGGQRRAEAGNSEIAERRFAAVDMLKLVAVITVAVFGFSAVPAAQSQAQQDLVGIFRAGSLSDRYRAAQDVLQIPPGQRSEALWLALANELQRVASESHESTDALIAGRQLAPLGEEDSEYYAELITAVADWRDPRALQPLISSVGRGMLVVQGIIPFGEVAVPPLIDAARAGPRGEQAAALGTLGILLEGFSRPPAPYFPPARISPSARQQILQLARDLLRPRPGVSRDLAVEAGLALATGDEELRQQVELLAREPGVVAQFTGLGDSTEIARIQNAIRFRLEQHKR